MKLRKAVKKDILPVSELISRTFAKFNFREGSKKAINNYVNFYNPKKNLKEIEKSFAKCNIFLIAEDNEKIIGVIRGNKSRIVNLFVDGRYHKKGIGKKLIEKFEKIAKKNNSDEIKVRASLYAINFYLKNGYKKTTGIKNMKGIKIQPMKKVLK